MQTELYPSQDRGQANFGWLNSYHTFSFGGYFNPTRMGFGKLRVLNDDVVAGGQGFGTHGHRNMEIISIPLSGKLHHEDSEGNSFVIEEGDVQIMSAGSGIEHSEMNGSKDESVNFLQIWIEPEELEIVPRYEQKSFPVAERRGRWQKVLSPLGTDEEGIKINQKARMYLGHFAGQAQKLPQSQAGMGLFLKVLSGRVELRGQQLSQRDALAISPGEPQAASELRIDDEAELLLIEVPL